MQTVFNALLFLTADQWFTISGVVYVIHVTLSFVSYVLTCIKNPSKYDKKERRDALDLFMLQIVVSVISSICFPISIAVYLALVFIYTIQWAARGFGNYIANKYDPYKENY